MYKEPPIVLKKPISIKNQHPLIKEYQDYLIKKKVRYLDRGRINPKREKLITIKVSPNLLIRGLRLMNSFLELAKAKGWPVKINEGYNNYETILTVDEEDVAIELVEKLQMKDRVRDENDTYDWGGKEWLPTGILLFRITNVSWSGVRQNWTDGKRTPIEKRLESFCSGILAASKLLKEKKTERELTNQRYEAERQKAQEAELLRHQEKVNIQALEEKALLWEKTTRIRNYLNAVEEKAKQNCSANDEKFKEWLKWARDYVDIIDPILKE